MTTGNSARVELTLTIGDGTHSLGAVGPDSIRFRHPPHLPPCEGTRTVTIDGHPQSTRVFLPRGSSPTDDEAPSSASPTPPDPPTRPDFPEDFPEAGVADQGAPSGTGSASSGPSFLTLPTRFDTGQHGIASPGY